MSPLCWYAHLLTPLCSVCCKADLMSPLCCKADLMSPLCWNAHLLTPLCCKADLMTPHCWKAAHMLSCTWGQAVGEKTSLDMWGTAILSVIIRFRAVCFTIVFFFFSPLTFASNSLFFSFFLNGTVYTVLYSVKCTVYSVLCTLLLIKMSWIW